MVGPSGMTYEDVLRAIPERETEELICIVRAIADEIEARMNAMIQGMDGAVDRLLEGIENERGYHHRVRCGGILRGDYHGLPDGHGSGGQRQGG